MHKCIFIPPPHRLLYRKRMKHRRAYHRSVRQRNTQSTEYLNATYEEPSRYQPTSNIYLGVGTDDISKHLDEHQQEPNSGITQEPPAYETRIQTHPTPTEPPTYENPTH